MKKNMLVVYTLVVLLLGACLGGGLAWAYGSESHVEMDGQVVAITMLSKHSARVEVLGDGARVDFISKAANQVYMTFE
jgi:dienelactone hydrolase